VVLRFDNVDTERVVDREAGGEKKACRQEYTLRLQIRHDDVAQLEQLKELIMTIDVSLSKPISLPIYPLLTSAQAQKKPKSVRLSLEAGMRKGLFVGAANVKTLPKTAVTGDVLMGSIELSSMKNKSKYSLPFQYVIPALPDSKKSKKDDEEEKKDLDLAAQLRDLQLAHVSKLKGEKQIQAFQQMIPDLIKKYDKFMPLLTFRMNYLAAEKHGTPLEIIDAANAVMAEIDRTSLALHYGKGINEEDEEQTKNRKEMDKTKANLVEALATKAHALVDLARAELKETKEKETKNKKDNKNNNENKQYINQFKETFSELKNWVEMKKKENKRKYNMLVIHQHIFNGEIGFALKLLNVENDNNKDGATDTAIALVKELRTEILDRLGWEQWKMNEKLLAVVKNPKDFSLP